MYRAAEFSVNTYFVQLALDVGMCDVTKMAEKLGVESNTPDAPISSYDDKPSFTLGTAEVRQLFRVPRVGVVAGSYVTSGEIARGARARLVRDVPAGTYLTVDDVELDESSTIVALRRLQEAHPAGSLPSAAELVAAVGGVLI